MQIQELCKEPSITPLQLMAMAVSAYKKELYARGETLLIDKEEVLIIDGIAKEAQELSEFSHFLMGVKR